MCCNIISYKIPIVSPEILKKWLRGEKLDKVESEKKVAEKKFVSSIPGDEPVTKKKKGKKKKTGENSGNSDESTKVNSKEIQKEREEEEEELEVDDELISQIQLDRSVGEEDIPETTEDFYVLNDGVFFGEKMEIPPSLLETRDVRRKKIMLQLIHFFF